MNSKTPQIISTINDLRALTHQWRITGQSSCLVPTMGALHDGHLSLVDLALREADHVVVTIFVNPTQFGPGEDFEAYPRQHETDIAKLASKNADAIFIPEPSEIYAEDFSTEIQVKDLTQMLCGISRPTHFSGVATIVAKLLNMAACDKAVFGEKDFQQLMLIKRIVRDLNINTQIIGAPIIREKDGLAMSSRNQYLSSSERQIAGQLNVQMKKTIAAIKSGDNMQTCLQKAQENLFAAGVDKIDYFEIRTEKGLELAHTNCQTSAARLFAAIHIGKTRLIDNMPV